MTLFCFAAIAMLCGLYVLVAALPHPLSDDFIDLINAKQNMWKAGRNFPQNMLFGHIQKLMGVIENEDLKQKIPVKVHDADLIASLPENFDPRNKWPMCSSLNEIRDQGKCGSCWAFGAVAAMTDRVCTYSNGKENFHFSAEDLVSCCGDCGAGCQGGNPEGAWDYWKTHGIVSGGNYNSSQGCRPYTIPPCDNGINPCLDFLPTPKCSETCRPKYHVPYNNDKRYGHHINIILNNEDQIRAELYKNGPVEGSFSVYEDFLNYKSGVYKHTHGKCVGGHAVKIMGWGVENGAKYWLIANSWTANWGDKGFFKFLRGVNHCGIESGIVAGDPL